ncbi:hypothetical protein A5N13_17365 [Arthrobacter sp. D4]|nr:hypothetical protein A5N13_17365 [Arthrobacter sp. D4]
MREVEQLLKRHLAGSFGGVDSIQHLGHGVGRAGAGQGWIAEVLAGMADIQGRESPSSLTSGTA